MPPNWSDLSKSVKKNVVGRLDLMSRRSLRCVSHSYRSLVDSSPIFIPRVRVSLKTEQFLIMIHSSIESWYRVEIRKTSDGKTEILKCQNSWDTVVKKTSEIAPNVEFVKILCGLVAHPTILIDGMEWEVQGGTNCSQEKVKISEKATLKSVRSIVEAMKKEVKREKVFRVTSLITTWNSFLELESLLRGCCSSDDLKSVERLTLNVSPESRVPTHCLDSCMCGYGFPNSSCTTINYSHIPYELMLVGLATTVGCYTTVRFSSLHAEAREVWDRVGTKVEVVADGVMMKKKTINNVSFYHIKTPCGYFIHAVAKESNRCKKIIRLDYHMKKWIADANRECGLGWLCKRHASPFDFHYYQNIGKRVFFEPEWSDIQVEDFDPRDLSLKKSVAMARRMFEKEEKKKGKKGAEPKAWGFKEEDPEASFFKNLQKTDPKTAESYVRVSAKLEICKDYCTQMSEISEKSPDMEICHQQLSQLAEQMEKTLKMAKEGNFKVLIKLDEETKDLDLFLEDTDAFRAPEEVSETLKLNSENVEKGSGSVKKAPEVKNSPKNFEKAAPGSKKNVEKASESVKKVPEAPSIPILKKETPDVRKVTSENQRNTMKVVRVKKATKEAPETQKSDSKDPSDSEFLTKLAKIDEKASEAYIFLLGLTNGQIPKKVLQIVGGKRNMEELLEKLKKTLIAVKMQTLTVFSVDGFNSVDVCLILNTIKSVAKHLGFASEDVPKSSDEEILKRMSNENKEIFQSLVKFLEKTDSFLLMTRCLLINAPISNKYSPEDIDQFQLLLGHLLEVNTRIERALGVVRERMTEAKSSSEIQSVMQEMKMMGEYARKIGTGFGTIEEKLKVRPDATPKNVEIVPETKTEAPIALKASEDVKKAPKIEKPADESLEDVKTVPKAPEEDEKIPEQDPSDSEFLSKLSKIDPKAAEAYSWLLEKAPEHPDHSENIESTLMVVRTKVLTVFSPGKFFDSHPVCAAFKRLKDLVKKLGGPQEKEEEEGEKERILNDLKSKKFEASYRYLRRFQKLSNVISVKARCLVLNGEVNGLTQEVIQKRKNDVEEVEKAREEVQRVMGMMKVAKTINEKRKARNQLPKTAEMARNVEEKYKKRSNEMEVRREVPSEDVEKGPVPPSIRIPRIEAPNVRKVTSEDQRNTLKVIRVKKATKEDVKTSKDALIEKLRVLDPEVAEVYSRSSDDVTYLQLVLLGLRTDDPKKSAGKQKEMIEELETLILGFAKIKFVFECIFNSSGDMFPVDQVDEAIEVIKDCGRAVQKVRHLVNGTPKPQEPPSDEETLKKLSPKASEDFKSLLEFQKAHQKTLLMAKYLIAFSLNDPNTKIPKNSIEKAHKTIKTLSAVLEPLDSLLTLVRLSPGQGSEALEEMKKKREIIEEIKRKIEGGRGDLEAFGEVDLNEKQENLKIKKVSPDVQNAPKAPPKPKDPVVEMLEMVDEEAAEVYSKIDDEIKFLTESEAAVKHLISIGKGTPEKLSEFKTLALALVPVISEAKEVRDSIREGVKDLMKSDVRNLDPTGVLTDIKRIKLMKWVFQQLRLMLSGKDPLPQPVSDELLLSKAPPEAIQDLRTCLDFVDLWRNKSLAIRCLVAHAKINPKSSIPQDTVERCQEVIPMIEASLEPVERVIEGVKKAIGSGRSLESLESIRSLKSAAQIVQKFDSNEIHELLDLTKSSDDSRIAAQLSQIAEKYGNAYRTTCQSLIIYQRSIQKMKKLLANALKSPDLQKDPLIPEILDLLPQVLGIPEALKGILAPIRAAFDDIGAREIVKRNAFYRIMISNEQFPQETRDRCEKIGDLVDKMKLEELEFPDDQTIRNVFPQWKGQKKPMYVNPKLSEYKQDVRDALLVENLSKIRPEAVEKLRILCASTSILRDFIRKAKGWIAHSSEPSSDEDYLRFMHLVLYHLPKSERNCGIFEESLEKIRNESSPLKQAQLITTFHDLILKDQEDKYVGLQPTVAILNWMCESRGVNLDVPLEIPNEKTLETRFPGFLEYKRKCLEEDGGDAEKKLPEPPKFEMSPEDKVIVGKLSKLDEKAAKNYGLAVEYLPISRRFLQKAKGLISMALKEPELRDLPGDMIKFCVDGLPTISESVSSFQFLVDAVRMTVDFPQKVRELFPALEQMINISDPSGGFSAYSHASNRIDSFYRQKRIQPPSSEEEEDLEFPEDEEIRMVFPNWEGIEKKEPKKPEEPEVFQLDPIDAAVAKKLVKYDAKLEEVYTNLVEFFVYTQKFSRLAKPFVSRAIRDPEFRSGDLVKKVLSSTLSFLPSFSQVPRGYRKMIGFMRKNIDNKSEQLETMIKAMGEIDGKGAMGVIQLIRRQTKNLELVIEASGIDLEEEEGREFPSNEAIREVFPDFEGIEEMEEEEEEDGFSYLDLTKEPEMELSPEDKEMVENLSKFNEEAGEKLMKIFRSLNILKEFVVMGKQFIAHSYSNGIPEGRAADFVLKRCLNIVSPFSVLFDHLDDKLDGIRSRKNPKDQVENIDIIQKAMIPLGNEESTNLGTIQLIEAIFERDGIKGDTLQYPDEEEITMKFPEYNNEDTIRKKKNLVKKYKDYTQDPEFQIDAEDALIAARFSKSHPKAAEVFSRLCIDMKVFKAYDPKMRVYISISMRDTSSDPQQLADAIESLEANQEFLNRVEEVLNGVRRSSVDPEAILHIDDAIHQAAKTMYSNMKKVEGVVAGKEEEEEPTMDNLQKAFPGFQFEQKKEYNDYREDPDFQLDPLDQNLVEKLYGIGEEKAARELQGAAQQLKVRTSFASKVGKYIKLCLEDTVCQKDQEFGERLYRTFDSIPKLRAENDYGDGVLGQIRRDLTHESLYSETKFREFYNEHYREAFRKGWFQPEYRGQMDEEEEQRDQAYYQLVKTMDTAFASIGKKLEELEDVELKDLEAAFPDVVHEDNDDFMKIIDNMNTERSAKWKFNVQRWAIFSGVLFAFFIFLYFYLIIVIFVSDVFKWFTGR